MSIPNDYFSNLANAIRLIIVELFKGCRPNPALPTYFFQTRIELFCCQFLRQFCTHKSLNN